MQKKKSDFFLFGQGHVSKFLHWFVYCLVLVVLIHVPLWGITMDDIREANELYSSGEQATTIAKRKEAFNQALAVYLHADEVFHPEFGNGKLYYNIANTYFQLGEYPQAILYYYRALKLHPRDSKFKRNLLIAEGKAGIIPGPEETTLQRLLFFHSQFSLPERLRLFFVLSLILLLLLSIYLWKRRRGWKLMAQFAGVLWLIMLCSVLFTRYFSPIEGVLVHPSLLYRDAGMQYATVDDQPVLSGTKVRVLEASQEGKWLKVITPSDQIGYISSADLNLI